MKKISIVVLSIVLTLMFVLTGCDVLTAQNVEPTDSPDDSTAKPTDEPVSTAEPEPTEEPVVDLDEWRDMAKDALPEYIPMEDVFGSPEYSSPSISPDGTMLLYRHITDTYDAIEVMDIETGEVTEVTWPELAAGIPYFVWAQDNETILFMVDHGGDENYGIHYSNIRTNEANVLLDISDTNILISGYGPESNQIYIQANYNDPTIFDLYLMDYTTGKTEPVAFNPGYITSYYFDGDNELRMIEANSDGKGGKVYFYIEGEVTDSDHHIIEENLITIADYPYEYTSNSGVISLTNDGEKLYFYDSSNTDTNVILELDMESYNVRKVTNDIGYDILGTWMDLEKDTITAYSYTGAYVRNIGLDGNMRSHIEKLNEISEYGFDIIDSSIDDSVWLVEFYSDIEGASYYSYDMESQEATYLFHSQPLLQEYTFAPMEPIAYTASDGLDIEGYITFPVGLERKDLPLVLMVHGGPWARDYWGFNSEVQWLANRGYAVLQVNFRGSTGYGREFYLAGDGEWAGAMHQDLLDAVDWAVENEYVDEDRVAIYGGSYGGYAALVGASFTPDVFACAVDMFGPSSLITLVENMPAYWEGEREAMYRSIGNPETDEEIMISKSPLYKAEDIVIPVLIVQGGMDVRVTDIEAEQMVDAMEEAGLEVEYMYFPDAGHGFNSYDQRSDFYSVCEQFLSEYIGGISGVMD